MQRSGGRERLPRMIPATDIVTHRFQLSVLAAILCQSLQSVAMPTIISAAEQEPPPRHSLIQRSAVESAPLPATTHGTVIQPLNDEPTHITTPIEPHKPSVSISPAPLPAPHHRTLTKRPPIATVTAPATSSQIPPGESASSIAAGQLTQATADTSKSGIPTATAPITKATAVPLAGVISSSSASVAPTAAPPFAGAAGVHSAASAGSGSAPSSSGSRSALNLLKNSAITSLLQPSTPVVNTPPSLPPPSTPPSNPPSTPPLPSPSTGSLTLRWAANGEPDLAGYKIYVGTASGTYSFPGSAFLVGQVTSYTITNLPKGQTYFLAISAYDRAGNESVLSAEVSSSLY
jgi:hypothetical protein